MTETPTYPVRMGVFDDVEHADQGVKHLLEAGFERGDITVICPERWQEHFSSLHEVEAAGEHTAVATEEGGALGALIGGAIGVAGVATTGGMGLLAFGALAPALGGGALAGGFIGAMLTRGVEPEVADVYDQALEDGSILIAIECSGTRPELCLSGAEAALRAAGARPTPLDAG